MSRVKGRTSTMNVRIASRIGVALALLLGAAPSARAQSALDFGLHGGAILPLSTSGEYFELGPSVGLDVAYPVASRVDLKLDLDLDVLNRNQYYPVPDIRFVRYRAGLEAGLLGDRDEGTLLVRAYVGAGGTTFRSTEFWVETRPTIDPERIKSTAITGTGGLRLGVRTGTGLVWWLGGMLNWAPLSDANKKVLGELSRNDLGPIGSLTSATLTLGFNLNR
jgi:hypothetical protein